MLSNGDGFFFIMYLQAFNRSLANPQEAEVVPVLPVQLGRHSRCPRHNNARELSISYLSEGSRLSEHGASPLNSRARHSASSKVSPVMRTEPAMPKTWQEVKSAVVTIHAPVKKLCFIDLAVPASRAQQTGCSGFLMLVALEPQGDIFRSSLKIVEAHPSRSFHCTEAERGPICRWLHVRQGQN